MEHLLAALAQVVPGRAGDEFVQTILVEELATGHHHNGLVFVLHVEVELVLADFDVSVSAKDHFFALGARLLQYVDNL